MGEAHALLEGRMRHRPGGRCDDVAALGALEMILDPEGQEGHHLAIGRRQQVIGVEIAHAGEDGGHLGVEAGLAVELGEPVTEQAKALERLDRVHRALQRQVDVIAFEKEDGLVDEGELLVRAERACAGEEGLERRGALRGVAVGQLCEDRGVGGRTRIGTARLGFLGHLSLPCGGASS